MSRERTAADKSRMAGLVIWGIALGLLVLFIVQNFDTVQVRFLFFSTETQLAFALLVAGVLGFVAGLALPRLRR
jgi:uncharacterized integral membrane protein